MLSLLLGKKTNLSLDKITFLIIIFSLLLSSSVKPATELSEGIVRKYSFFINLVSSNSIWLAVLSIGGASFFLYKYSLKFLKFPALSTPITLFLLLKIWAIFNYAIFGEVNFTLIISFLITLTISSYILAFDKKTGKAFQEASKAIAIYGIIFVLLNVFEFYVNAESVIWAGRLFGITNHPNFIGGYCAILSPFVLQQTIERKGLYKFVYALTFLSLFLMISSSGSRSSLASFCLGMLIFFIFHWGFLKAILTLSISGLLLYFSFEFILGFSQESGLRYERLLSSENTRSYVIWELWNVYLQNFFLGNPIEAKSTANSYLLVLARLGSIGGIILIFIISSTLKNILSILLKNVTQNNDIAYLSSFSIILLYSFFEGVLVENYSLGQ
ncbi:MAG: hypothetical protein ABJV04_16190, partial [Aliiglaciecola sp.]|uniref:hypothetical protein n=1 Tax=Aliiglaciecola sp. TaxID=1872441 RepID=UPI0032971523